MRLAAHQQQQQLLRVLYAAWTGVIFISSRMRPSRCTYVQYKALYVRRKQHAHMIAMRRWRSNGHNIHQNLKRAVERFAISNQQNSVDLLCRRTTCAPSIISHVDNPKKGIPANFMALIPPFFAFTPTVQSLELRALCKATLCALFLEGKRLPLPLRWKPIVGGILSAPKIPIEKKLRSDHSLPLPRISPTSITYAEGYAHWTLVGAGIFWPCRLMTCIWHNVTLMLFSPIAGK